MVKKGAGLQDTHAAIKAITTELLQAGKRVILLGGSHNLMMAKYNAFAAPNITTEQSRCGALSPDQTGATEMQSSKLILYPGITNSIRLRFVMEETGDSGNFMTAVYDINGLLITAGVIKPNRLQTLYSNRLGQGIYTVVITANGTRVANEKIMLGH